MSQIIESAVVELNEKAKGSDLAQTVKYIILEHGTILVDGAGARIAKTDSEADLTITADAETFQGIQSGEESSQLAFMSGKLKLEGDMGLAMRLDSILG
jgi:putative sterol carrier protein